MIGHSEKDNSDSSDKNYLNNDLGDILKICFKKRKFILVLTFLGFLGGIIYSRFQKDVWEGQMQIVLEEKKNNHMSGIGALDSNLNQIINLKGKNNILNTQVEILKSPSVLSSVFKYVKEEKSKKDERYKNAKYRGWAAKHLDIKLVSGTSVLNIIYRDHEKKIILPVLKKISKEYRFYSGKNKLKELNNGLDYLNKQINIYKVKSLDSFEDLESFKNKYNIYETNPEVISTLSNSDELENNSPNIFIKKANADYVIKEIDEILKQFYSSENDENAIILIAQNIPEISSVANKVEELKRELFSSSLIYKQDDITIKKISLARDNYINYLKKEIPSFLNAKKASALAALKSATKPEGVIVEYKKLLRSSVRNEEILSNLENQQRLLSLEKAKVEEPWQLITKPVLSSENPILPNRFLMIAASTVCSILIGVLFAVMITEEQYKLLISKLKIK
jgi:uncharacterized protein involved in exopolysaccharide biosynthesis